MVRVIITIWNEKHPIDGFNKMLEEQILLPTGTPIMASGSGTIKMDGVEVAEIM